MSATTLNLAALLEYQARLTPDRIAVVCGEHRVTYGQLNAAANQVAAGLQSMGFGPGDHIAMSCPNIPQFPITYFGILKLGAIVVPLSVTMKTREVAYYLGDSDAKAFIVHEGTTEWPMAQTARAACDVATGCRSLIVITSDPGSQSPVPLSRTLAQVMHRQLATFETHPTAPADTAVILYTSGTTGPPKGAELSHLSMVVNAMACRDMVLPLLDGSVDGRTVSLITLPLFHSTAQTVQMNAGFAGGFRLVLVPQQEPAQVLAAMSKEQASYWVGVPTMYWTLLEYARESEIDIAPMAAALRVCVSVGAPLPVPLLREFEDTLGVRVLEGYGLSETSPVACFNQVFKPSKPGTVGYPIFGCEVRVVDADGRPLPMGERGEIIIRGHNVMKGYYKRPVETAAALRHGWFHTGDVGVFDSDGYLTVVDRKKDLLTRSGVPVYPHDVEEVLMMHPDVSLVAVVGIPDREVGEEVKAFVVRKPGASLSADELITWSREQLAEYKYPRSVEFREALPVSPTGKVLKRKLRM